MDVHGAGGAAIGSQHDPAVVLAGDDRRAVGHHAVLHYAVVLVGVYWQVSNQPRRDVTQVLVLNQILIIWVLHF